MDSYRESSNKAKAIRAGIVDARPVSKGQKNKVKDWLIISLGTKNLARDFKVRNEHYVGTIAVVGEYASEQIAFDALPRSYLPSASGAFTYMFGRYYVINKDVFENTYKPLWRKLLDIDINKHKLLVKEENGLDTHA